MPYDYPIKYGKYLLTRRISVGGMAEVFKAKLVGPKGFEKVLAVKKILPEFNEDEEFVQMFVDEARISSNLHHNNIVQVFDFGEFRGSYYIAMEYIDGPNLKNLLRRYLKEKGIIPQNLCFFIGMEIARALEYAHRAQIEGVDVLNLVHRDVSPQNVLISRRGEVKITDFGIAKAAIKLSKTQPGKIQGKISYMSPEQASGKPIDRRSDIFSLGIILYELLSGIKVYAGDETSSRYQEVREANIPRLGSIIPQLPSQLESLVMKMLSKEPDDRPQNCSEVIKELDDILSDRSKNRLASELGSVITELFPKEETSFPKKDSSLLEKGAQEPGAGVDPKRIHFLPDEAKKHEQTTPAQSGEKTEIELNPAISTKLIITLSAFLIVLLLGAFFSFQIFWDEEDPGSFKNQELESQVIETRPTPETSVPASPAPALNNEENQQLQERLSELEQQVFEAEQRATRTKQELDQTKTELDQISAAVQSPCPQDMTLIRGGNFIFGSDRNDRGRNDLVEAQAQLIPIQSFCIDPYEYPNRKGALPKVQTSWREAQALCTKRGKRLCLQEEWERACKGPSSAKQNIRYPYGKTWNFKMCNTQKKLSSGETQPRKLAKSGSFPKCKTSEGIFDLSGNIDEWTQSLGRFNTESRITKGGSYLRPGHQTRCSSIREVLLSTKEQDLGFRCCKDAI